MIPTEIDELMWTIAESGDQQAIDEFGNRYPNLREELLKRMKTVNALKAAGKSVTPSRIPSFRNPNIQKVNLQIAWSCIAVAAITISSFAIWRMANPVQPTGPVTPVTFSPRDDRHQRRSLIVPRQPETQATASDHGGNAPANQGFINSPVVPKDSGPVPMEKTTVQLDSASLHAAIIMIAEAGKLKVTIAPGTPNPDVKIDLKEMTPMDMLKQLGSEYAFDVIPDGNREILVVPKKDDLEDSNTSETR